MRRWIETHFTGKSAAEFYAHNGTVPSAEEMDEAHMAKKRVGMPPELGKGYGEITHPADILEILTGAKVPEATRKFLDSVVFEGDEQPPAAGERYSSVLSGSTYTVIDVRRKLYSTDRYVTMERDGDKHRTKFIYRDHAAWLTLWRPADDEGNAREAAEVGETAHEAASAMFEFHATDAIARVVRELNKRLPDWIEQPPGPVVYDTTDLIIRAIRSLVRQRDNASNDLQAANREAAKLSDKNRELSSLLGARTREVDKLKQERGGAWDAARVRREQDTMRELLRHYALLFVRHHGRATLKRLLAELDAETLLGLPHEHFMLLVTRCEAHSDRQGG